MTHAQPTLDSLRRAIETRDAKSLKAFYADDAVLTIIDSDNPPSKPRTIKGAKEIGAFLDDVYGREMTHRLESAGNGHGRWEDTGVCPRLPIW